MKKFTRTRKDNNQEIEMFGTDGVLRSISDEPKANSNGNKYYNFTAEIEMPRGKILCLGQVYENSFEFLGGKPEVGGRFAFSTELEQLMQANNKVWSISGNSIDELDEALLADIDML